ncbi:MAG: DUF2298 domain-containing protein, partial [Anaerolineae bacterium]
FFAVDSLLAFFVTLTLYWLVRLVQGEGREAAVWAGIAMALAIACKSSAAPLVLPWALAFVLRARKGSHQESGRLLVQSAIAGAVTFTLVSPYVLLDLKLYLDSIGFESRMVRGTYDLPYTRQYRRTPAFIYPILQQLRWGMGWLPGLLAFCGLGWGIWRTIRRTVGDGELLLLTWCLPYFLLTGGFMVKFMRYMAPLVPLLLVLGSGLVAHVAGRWPRWRPTMWALAAATVLYAILWSAAFTAIYRHTFSRQEASVWIYRNIPKGSVITKEEWDDLIPYPLVLDGKVYSPDDYDILAFPLQEPDDIAKVEMLVDRLTRADYIVISSNRFYGWLPRLHDRYPVSSRYYELLFAGQLGFELEHVFTSYPRLGPFQFDDDHADESFTVYDHPKVLIYRKVRTLPEEDLRSLFLSALAQAGREEGDDELLLPMAVDAYPSVADYSWNPWARDGLAAVLWWWLVASLLGLAAWPLLAWLLGGLWAGGWPFARILGLLLVGYVPWLLASLGLVTNTAWALSLALGALILVGVLVAYRQRQQWRAFLVGRWWELVSAEVLALLAYLGFTGIRLLNPDLWHPWWGGERPMEMGFLLAILKSGRFPPYDPFYAGGYINYYYYGLYLVACLVKLSGIPPEVAFNLALAFFYSALLAGAATVAASLATKRRLLAAIWAAVLVGLLGNIEGGLQLLRSWGELGADAPGGGLPLVGWLPKLVAGLAAVISRRQAPPSYDFWGPTRVIPETINEFPYFSFLYGDLHPHILDMPVVLLGLAIALVLYRELADGLAVRRRASFWGKLLLLAGLTGVAIATNTWDAPLLLAIVAGAAVLASKCLGWRLLPRAGIIVAALAGLGAALFLPFLADYRPPPGGFGLTGAGSPVLHFLRIWGLFALLSLGLSLTAVASGKERHGLAGFLALVIRHWRRLPRLLELIERSPIGRRAERQAGFVLLAIFTLLVLLVVVGRGAAAIALLLAAAAFLAAWTGESREQRFASGLAALAWLILLGTELLYLRDWLAGGPAYRMNTVFKFGIQAWLLLGLACGAQAALFWRSHGYGLGGWRAATLVLIVLAGVYPLLATPARLTNRFPNGHPPVGTLNGLAFMQVGEYFWPDENHPISLAPEYEALRWLRDHVQGTPVVAEAALGYYREGGSRVAAYTGLPIPLGPQHEPEQRPRALIGERSTLVRRLYETPDPEEALDLLEKLGVSYIYIGQLERIFYGEGGLAKFEEMAAAGWLERVFANGVVKVYGLK